MKHILDFPEKFLPDGVLNSMQFLLIDLALKAELAETIITKSDNPQSQ